MVYLIGVVTTMSIILIMAAIATLLFWVIFQPEESKDKN